MPIITVLQAERYRYGALGSLGDARCMLMRQYQFPNTYDTDKDRMVSAEHDRMMQWDYTYMREVLAKHLQTGELAIGDWCRNHTPEQVMAFLRDAFKVEENSQWTGFRVLGTVNRSNGYPVFSLELFWKHPESNIPVYSGEDAPNVKGGYTEYEQWDLHGTRRVTSKKWW